MHRDCLLRFCAINFKNDTKFVTERKLHYTCRTEFNLYATQPFFSTALRMVFSVTGGDMTRQEYIKCIAYKSTRSERMHAVPLVIQLPAKEVRWRPYSHTAIKFRLKLSPITMLLAADGG